MAETEKLEYLARVEKWTEETYPQLSALTDSWTESDWKDYDEGMELVTALQHAKDFVSNAYRYEIKRSLAKMNLLLTEVRRKTELGKMTVRRSDDKRHFVAHMPAASKADENGVKMERKSVEKRDVLGRRQEHLSQYIELIGDDLKKESAQLAGWYDQLAHWRGRAEYLADDPRSTQEMLKNVAATVVKIEQRILNFWERVDIAYNKATGKQVDESVMNSLKKEADELRKEESKQDGEYTKEEIDAMEDGEDKERCKRARIEADKKFVRRTDIKMNDERKAQIAIRLKELVEWGQKLSEKAISFAQENGIELPNAEPVKPKETLFD
ncbi:MAG: hypothetical protein ACI4C3_01145 [Bacteroides sp.]